MMSRVLALSCAALAAAQNTTAPDCNEYTMQPAKPADAPKSQDYCYNAGTCEWGEFKATPCAADPCRTGNNECGSGYTCKPSYCGGCNWQCVKLDPCALVKCANCRADPVSNEAICGPARCESNNDCGKDEFCRQDQNTASQSCLTGMTCVKKLEIGGKCSGRVEPCFTALCRSGLICQNDVPGVAGGTCAEQVVTTPTCKSEDDCSKDEFCRQKVGGKGISPCLEEKTCVKKSNVGEKCSGKVLPCQTAMCRSGLVCKNDDPSVADAGGKCVEEPKPCTPYREADRCITLAGVCYNMKECKCGQYPQSVCKTKACNADSCKAGYECRESSCGGCNFQCVKMDVSPTCEEGKTWKQDCNTCSCRNGMAACTKIACPTPTTCKSEDDCSKDEFCRQKVGGKGISPCLEEKTCVKKSNVGEKCSGKVLPCHRAMCRSGLVCKNDDPTVADVGGKCVEEVLPPKCEEGKTWKQDCNTCSCRNGMATCTEMACSTKCKSDDDCGKEEFCKPDLGGNGFSPCLETMTCVKKSKVGEKCSGKVLPCHRAMCRSDLVCKNDDPTIMDAGGKCQEKVGAVCKEGTTWKKDCNTCSCSNGRALCTMMACVPDNAACRTDGDCSRDEFCRQKQNKHDSRASSPCLEERQCVKKADVGETCSGYMPACFANRCREGLMCKNEADPRIADIPGVCREEVVAECKEGKKWEKDCNTCSCEGGMVFCTEMDCQNPDKEKEKEKENAKTRCVKALKEKTLSGNQKKMCCRAFAVGCGDAVNVCFDTAKRPTLMARRACCWDHRQWCMNNDCEDKGVCPLDELREVIREEAPRLARRLAGKLLRKLRTRMEDVDAAELRFNPKKLLARVRRTLLKASATLRKDPSRLIVQALKGKDVQVDVPLKWNDDMAPLEEDLTFDAAVVSRGAAALQSVDGFTVDYIVDDKAVPELEKATAAGVAADGSAQTMAIKAGTKTEVVKDEEESDDDTAIWPIVLGSVLGATCIGGVALLTVYKKKQESNELTDFQQMAAAEELHGNAAHGGEEMANCKL